MKSLWIRVSLMAVCISFLVACGGSNTESSKSTDSTSHNSLSVMGVDGPMAGADVDVFDLQAYLDDAQSAPSLLLSPSITDSDSALAENLALIESAGSGPFIVIVSANASTIDLTTGLPPVISSVSTIIPELSDNRVYASPLTTLAVTIASYGRSVAADVVDELDSARVATITHFGFGMNFDIDFFAVPPVLDETTHSAALQQQVAEYRTAAEVFATMVEQLVKADVFSTHADAVKAIALDVSDDVIDDVRVLAEIENVDEFYLTNKKRLSGSVVELLESDSTGLSHPIDSSVDYIASSSFSEIFVKQVSSVVSSNVDSDLDGVSDDIDNCINTPNANQLDRGGINSSIADGVGDACQCGDVNGSGRVDNTDAILIKRFTLDLPPSINTDHCNVNGGNTCDNTDAILIQRAVLGLPPGLAQTCVIAVNFPDIDNDNVADGIDNCPADANTDQANLDNDVFGDVCDDNKDGDDFADAIDFCPLTFSTDNSDTDNDSLGDSCDADDDNDSVNDEIDNCPLLSNENQNNNDLDAQGDVCDSDDDNDNVADILDNCPLAANSDQADFDGDQAGNVCDLDDDNDTVIDVIDNCPSIPNSLQLDNDLDGIGNQCDFDDDNDSVADFFDNCPFVSNASQSDIDDDGQGDVCDSTPNGDDDLDGIDNLEDNCPLVANADQLDIDGDQVGDVCDADTDNDNIDNSSDNCPVIPNEDQLNSDGDLFGNVCDDDDDNDLLLDEIDNCPTTANADQLNTDNDSLGDACDADDDNDSVADVIDNCPLIENADQLDTDIDNIGDICDSTPNGNEWQLVWSDEFEGTELDPNNWNIQIGDGKAYGLTKWGNNEDQYYTDSPDNIRVEDGNMVITSLGDGVPMSEVDPEYGNPNTDYEFTSARVTTSQKVEFTYGRVEANIKIQSAAGLWQAFWLLGSESSPYGSWPQKGEIDIMEAWKVGESKIGGAVHFRNEWPLSVFITRGRSRL